MYMKYVHLGRLANRLFQNNWIFSISILVPKPLIILFWFFLQKNLKSIAFPIVCEKGVILQNRTA